MAGRQKRLSDRIAWRTVTLLLASGAIAGCAAGTAAGPSVTAVPPAAEGAVPATAGAPDFADWLEGVRAEALAAGVSPVTLDRVLTGLQPLPDVLAADANQPEFTRQIWTYLDGAVSPARVARGRELLDRHGPLFQAVERRYGVPGGIVAAIWAMESNYGTNVGSTPVVRALATLAHTGRRTGYGREQLIAALQIIDRGDIEPGRMVGSWAGAMGQTQFIPTTYRQFAVDADADGRRDLWHSLPDVFASTANYLAASGWRRGVPWGAEVFLPAGFDLELADSSVVKPAAQWRALGIRSRPGTMLAPDEPASLLLPAGHQGPAFLVTDSFRAVLRYNNSTSYALAVGHLADRLRGAGPVEAAWPRHLRALSRDERTELQRLLSARGYEPGVPDGIVGPMTRAALRRYQKDEGLPADGFATAELLERLRRESALS